MSSIPLDVQADGSQVRLYNLLRDGYVPEWVKSAAVEDVNPEPTAPPSCFAHPARRLLPCHTKSAAAVSAGYFFAAPELYPDAEYVRGRLLEKMAVFGLEPPAPNEPNVEAPTEPLWAYEEDGHRAAPVTDVDSFHGAAAYLLENRSRMNKSAARRMAERLLKSAHCDGADGDVRKKLMKVARLGYSSQPHVENLLDLGDARSLLADIPKLSKKARFYGPAELRALDRAADKIGLTLPDGIVEHTLDDVERARQEERTKRAKTVDTGNYDLVYGDGAVQKLFADLGI